MNVYHGIDGLTQVPRGSVMSIGNFDGLHRGHAEILATMKRLRDATAPPSALAVVTFEPHPLTVLRPQLAPPRLTPPKLKQQLLEEAGVKHYVVLPPTREVLDLSAEEFWRILRDTVRPAHLVEGGTFNFGKDRHGTIDRLREWARESDVKLHVIDGVSVPLTDLLVAPVSSSVIRWLLAHGRVRDAAICLGRPYLLEGVVGGGHQRGKKLGTPTANMNCGEQLVPADGVYAARCTLEGRIYATALSIGNAPTFGDAERQVEAYLIGYGGDLYGRTLHVEVIDWLRDQWKYPSVEQLKRQIARDVVATQRLRDIDPSRSIAAMS
jgi:riboflavin kinase/FMN adenylyltransferase